MENDLVNNLDKVHTTKLGKTRIKKNLQLKTDDIVSWCKKKISDPKSLIIRNGKNYYITNGSYLITVNASSYTIITARRQINLHL